MSDNPWNVNSVQDFWYLKCPECFFDTQEEDIFQLHAVENHPLSHWLFGVTKKELKIEKEPTEQDEELNDNNDDNDYDQGYM